MKTPSRKNPKLTKFVQKKGKENFKGLRTQRVVRKSYEESCSLLEQIISGKLREKKKNQVSEIMLNL